MTTTNLKSKALDAPNEINDVSMDFGLITADFQQFTDLDPYKYSSMTIISTLNRGVVIQFNAAVGGRQLEVQPGTSFTLDNFSHLGVIQIKASDILPISGSLKMVSW